MNTKIIIGTIIGAVIIGGAVFFMTIDKPLEQKSSACADLCQQAHNACPSLINQALCENECESLDEEAKKHFQESTNCEEMSAKPELIADMLIPDVATLEPIINTANDCEAACGSYVGKCLTLVPNATPELFNDGLSSCMSECAGWDSQKVNCMISAFDCEAMTNTCGL